jgi:alpha-galactosidase
MDVLTTGGAGCSLAAHCPGQTEDEYRTEFAIWTLTQSPLMIATDVRNMSSLAQATLLNAEILSVHQSTATLPGRRLATAADACALPALCAVWGRALDAAGTTWILALVNLDNISVQEVSVSFADLGWNASAMAGALVRDLWARHDLPDATGGKVTARVPTHGTALLRVERIGNRDP